MPRRPRATRRPALVGLAVLALLVAACGGSDAPDVSFDPTGPCTADGQAAGAYPDLESLLPTSYQDQQPKTRDSGRTCLAGSLGSLAGHGIKELRFAGDTWDLGGTRGMTLAVFDAAGLDTSQMLEFYETGASAARRTDKLQTSDTTVGGKPAKRLDVLGSDGSTATVVAWPTGSAGRVWVLLAADMGDTAVTEALATFGAR